jgi:hypothetical protein
MSPPRLLGFFQDGGEKLNIIAVGNFLFRKRIKTLYTFS